MLATAGSVVAGAVAVAARYPHDISLTSYHMTFGRDFILSVVVVHLPLVRRCARADRSEGRRLSRRSGRGQQRDGLRGEKRQVSGVRGEGSGGRSR